MPQELPVYELECVNFIRMGQVIQVSWLRLRVSMHHAVVKLKAARGRPLCMIKIFTSWYIHNSKTIAVHLS